MAGLPKAYFKRFPGDLKKAWSVYKREKGGAAKVAVKVKGKVGSVMAKKSKAKHIAHKVASKARSLVSGGVAKVVVGSLVATGGAVVTSMAVNKLPVTRDLSAGKKALVQFLLGLGGVLVLRKPILQQLAAGSMMAGVFGGVTAVTKISPIAGPGRTLTGEQLASLVRSRRMGIPAEVSRGRMGIPAEVSRGRMGVPASVRMNGSGFSNFGSF